MKSNRLSRNIPLCANRWNQNNGNGHDNLWKPNNSCIYLAIRLFITVSNSLSCVKSAPWFMTPETCNDWNIRLFCNGDIECFVNRRK